jgi:beta-lactamase regulating signal transducer with metallopeptidase domain/protocatechuate 3,4-dioxygenase beta subunit
MNEWISLAWSQVWQVTALAAVVGVVARIACRKHPHITYVLWMLVVFKCLTPPLWSSPTGVFSWIQARPEVFQVEEEKSLDGPAASKPVYVSSEVVPPDDAMIEPTTLPHSELPQMPMLQGELPRQETPSRISPMESTDMESAQPATAQKRPTIPPAEAMRLQTEPSQAAASAPAASQGSWLAWFRAMDRKTMLVGAWLAGMLAMSGLLFGKWLHYCKIFRRCAVAADPGLESLAVQLAERLGLRCKVRVMVVSEPIGPAVFGVLQPIVVLPEVVVSQKTLIEIEPILAHELVHIRRGDAYWGLLQLIVEVLWWFHPLVWWANRELCRERERCCDEEVVAGLQYRPATYARCLVDVLELKRHWQPMLASPGVRSVDITSKRLEDIMTRSNRFHARTPRWTWALLFIVAMVFLPGGAMVIAQNDTAPKDPPTQEKKPTAVGESSPTQETKAAAPAADEPAPTVEETVAIQIVTPDDKPIANTEFTALNGVLQTAHYQTDAEGLLHVAPKWLEKETLSNTPIYSVLLQSEKGLGWYAFKAVEIKEDNAKNNRDGRQTGVHYRSMTEIPKKIVIFPCDQLIEGDIVDSKDNPLAHVPVQIDRLEQETNGPFWGNAWQNPDCDSIMQTVSDDHGHYKVYVPKYEKCSATAKHPDYMMISVEYPFKAEKGGKIVLSRPAAKIHGRVIDTTTGKPIQGAVIGADSYEHFMTRCAISDEEGRYTLSSLCPFSWNVYFYRHPQKPELVAVREESVDVKAGESAEIDVQVTQGRVLQGQVMDAMQKTPIPNLSVGCYDAMRIPNNGEREWYRAGHLICRTDAEGRFKFYVPPGKSHVYVPPYPFTGLCRNQTVVVKPDEDPAPVVLSGVLDPSRNSQADKRAKDPEPYGNLHVFLRPSDKQEVNVAMMKIYRISEKNTVLFNQYAMAGNRLDISLPMYAYTGGKDGEIHSEIIHWAALLDSPDYARSQPVEFTFQRQEKPLAFTLEKPTYVPVRGRVVDADGKPVAKAKVAVSLKAVGNVLEEPWGDTYQTQEDGTFELKEHLYVGCRFAIHATTDHREVTSHRFQIKKDTPIDLGDLKLHNNAGDNGHDTTAGESSPTQETKAAAPTADETVAIQIVTPDDEPIANTEFTAKNLLWKTCQYRTDADGLLHVPAKWLKETKESDCTLLLKNGDNLGWHSLIPTPTPNGIHFTTTRDYPQKITMLPCDQVVEGDVMDAKGNPIPKTPVRVIEIQSTNGKFMWNEWEKDLDLPKMIATSDAQGHYAIRVPKHEDCVVIAEHPDYLPVRRSVSKKEEKKIVLSVLAGKIRGRVVDAATGEPIQDALISASWTPSGINYQVIHRTISDKNGQYTLSSLLFGYWDVRLEYVPKKPELIAVAQNNLEVKTSETIQAADFQAAPGRLLQGQVVDAFTKSPLSSILVGCFNATRSPINMDAIRYRSDYCMHKTDAEGRFKFYVPSGKTYVYVTSRDFEGTGGHRVVTIKPDEDPAPVVLSGVFPQLDSAETKEQAISRGYANGELQVVSLPSDGEKVDVAMVNVYQLSKEGPVLYNRYPMTGNVFKISLPIRTVDHETIQRQYKKTRWVAIMDAVDYARSKPIEFTFDQQMQSVVFNLDKPKFVSVRGRVVDADGKPVAKANIAVSLDTVGNMQEEPWGATYQTQEDGTFELKEHLYVGCRFAIHALTDEAEASSHRFRIEKNTPIDLGDLKLHGDAGDNGHDTAAAKSAVNQSSETKPVEANANSQEMLSLKVLNSESKPIANTEFTTLNGVLQTARYRTDAEGVLHIPTTWIFDRVRFSYRLLLQTGNDLGWLMFQSRRDNPTVPTEVFMLPCNQIVEGDVVDSKGNPIPNAKVYPVDLRSDIHGVLAWGGSFRSQFPMESPIPIGKLLALLNTATDAQGHYVLHVPAAVGEVVVEHPDYIQEKTTQSKKIVLVKPAGKIHGRVTSPDGKPVPNTYVWCADSQQPTDYHIAMTDADGEYTLQGLPVTPQKLRFIACPEKSEWMAVDQNVKIKQGETVEANLQLTQGRLVRGQVLDANNNAPVPNLLMYYSGRDLGWPFQSHSAIFTDTDGKFEFYALPGNVVVNVAQRIDRPFVGETKKNVTVAANKDPEPIVLKGVLKEQQTKPSAVLASARPQSIVDKSRYQVDCRVQTCDNRPLSDVTVQVWQNGDAHPMQRALCQGNAFCIPMDASSTSIERLARDAEAKQYRERTGKTFSLIIDAPGYARPKPIEFTYGMDMPPIVFNLEKPTMVSVRGRAVDAQGEPIARATVSVSLNTVGDAVEDPWGPEYATENDGTFEIKHVQIGSRFAVHLHKEHYQDGVSERMQVEKNTPIDLGNLVMPNGDSPKTEANHNGISKEKEDLPSR